MPEAGGSARLSDLESRWRFDRSPRVFLQFADELRRSGALPRAIEVLQEGLSHHPESVSGRVALGRALLEAGDPSAAAESLERVLVRDPAQIVASKLLIEAWIRIGNAARARERLAIYRILQERDAEIDDYERRIAAMERTERMPAVIELAGVSAPSPPEEPALQPSDSEAIFVRNAEPLFELGAARELPPLELVPDAEIASEPSTRGSAVPAEPPFDWETPFGAIHEPRASSARILNFFRAEAIFLTPSVAVSDLVVAPALEQFAAESVGFVPSAPIALEAEAPEVAIPEVSVGAALVVLPSLGIPDSTLVPVVELDLVSELGPGMTFEQFSTTGFAAEVERESLVEPLADVLGRAGIDAEALPAIAHPVGAELFEPQPVEAENAPSATLARLYLDQGHLLEAETEFRRVLEARPDDDAVLAGLNEVARRRAGDETVSGWGDAASPPLRVHRSVGLTQRKVEALRTYLERLRRGRARTYVS